MKELLSLIIVEDEDDIRTGLATAVNWSELGFAVAATFSSGEAAQDYLAERSCDVVLTDICLGGISGLDLAKWLSLRSPDTKVILLSGYSDFRYAQLAINYRCSRYLLKPIDLSELRAVFQSIYAERSRISKETAYRHRADQYFLKSLLSLMLRGKTLGSNLPYLMKSTLSRYTLHNGWVFCRMSFSAPCDSLEDLFDEAFAAHDRFCIASVQQEQCLYLLALTKEGSDLDEEASALEIQLDRAADLLLQTHGLRFSVTVYQAIRQYADLESYVHGIRRETPQTQAEPNVRMQELIRSINALNLEEVRPSLPMLDSDAQRAIAYLLLARLTQFGDQFPSDRPLVEDAEFSRLSSETGTALQQHIAQILSRFEGFLSRNSSNIVEKACLYIDGCHGRKVSLTEVADHIFVSPAYLSKLFKKQKNVNFKNYVSAVSLDCAKNLLVNTQVKVCDISEQLGFKDTRYFYKFFSDATGMTPTEYRKTYRSKA